MTKESSLIFTGDIGFDKYMDKRWKAEDLLDEGIKNYLKTADHLIINVEGPLSDQVHEKASGAVGLKHSMSSEVADFFDTIGADVWNICNNHIMDDGPDGICKTLEIAGAHNVKTLGAGMNIYEASKPVIFDEAGGIGLIGVGYQRACRKASEDVAGCLSWSDMNAIQKCINDIKKTCRWCIIVAHGGEEFTAIPSPYTRDRYIEYLNMGADIVVSHHPHVPMNYETFEGKAIFYSLGNFIFDTDYQRAQFNTEKGLFVKIKFSEDSFSFEPYGLLIDRVEERILSGPVPQIFVDVQAEEYEKLKALAAKMFIENTKRQWRFLKPDKFLNATDEDWYENFYEPLRSGRVPGEVLDFQIIYPLSLQAEDGIWKTSKLDTVKNFILEQL